MLARHGIFFLFIAFQSLNGFFPVDCLSKRTVGMVVASVSRRDTAHATFRGFFYLQFPRPRHLQEPTNVFC